MLEPPSAKGIDSFSVLNLRGVITDQQVKDLLSQHFLGASGTPWLVSSGESSPWPVRPLAGPIELRGPSLACSWLRASARARGCLPR